MTDLETTRDSSPNRTTLSVGTVANTLHVSAGVVERLFDSGQLRGSRISASGVAEDRAHRRIFADSLHQYMQKKNIPHNIAELTILTTGEVAEILHVSSRTIGTLFDNGQLEGYYINASGRPEDRAHRRIFVDSLHQYMQNNGIPANVAARVVVTTNEVAEILHLSSNTISKLLDNGQLEGYYISASSGPEDHAHRRIFADSLHQYMQNNGIPANVAARVIITTSEAAKILRRSLSTVNKMLDSGQLRGYRIKTSDEQEGDRRIFAESVLPRISENTLARIELKERMAAQEHVEIPKAWKQFLEQCAKTVGVVKSILYVSAEEPDEQKWKAILGDTHDSVVKRHSVEMGNGHVSRVAPAKLVMVDMQGQDLHWARTQIEKAKGESGDRPVFVIGGEDSRRELSDAGADRVFAADDPMISDMISRTLANVRVR